MNRGPPFPDKGALPEAAKLSAAPPVGLPEGRGLLLGLLSQFHACFLLAWWCKNTVPWAPQLWLRYLSWSGCESSQGAC